MSLSAQTTGKKGSDDDDVSAILEADRLLNQLDFSDLLRLQDVLLERGLLPPLQQQEHVAHGAHQQQTAGSLGPHADQKEQTAGSLGPHADQKEQTAGSLGPHTDQKEQKKVKTEKEQ